MCPASAAAKRRAALSPCPEKICYRPRSSPGGERTVGEASASGAKSRARPASDFGASRAAGRTVDRSDARGRPGINQVGREARPHEGKDDNERCRRARKEDRRRASRRRGRQSRRQRQFHRRSRRRFARTVELVMAFEEEFGVEIPDDQAETIVTVGDAVKFLEKATAAK